jgi:hypothetical protein
VSTLRESLRKIAIYQRPEAMRTAHRLLASEKNEGEGEDELGVMSLWATHNIKYFGFFVFF